MGRTCRTESPALRWRQRIPSEVVPKIKTIYAQGVSCKRIADTIGVGYATAYRAIHGIGAYAPKEASA